MFGVRLVAVQFSANRAGHDVRHPEQRLVDGLSVVDYKILVDDLLDAQHVDRLKVTQILSMASRLKPNVAYAGIVEFEQQPAQTMPASALLSATVQRGCYYDQM